MLLPDGSCKGSVASRDGSGLDDRDHGGVSRGRNTRFSEIVDASAARQGGISWIYAIFRFLGKTHCRPQTEHARVSQGSTDRSARVVAFLGPQVVIFGGRIPQFPLITLAALCYIPARLAYGFLQFLAFRGEAVSVLRRFLL